MLIKTMTALVSMINELIAIFDVERHPIADDDIKQTQNDRGSEVRKRLKEIAVAAKRYVVSHRRAESLEDKL